MEDDPSNSLPRLYAGKTLLQRTYLRAYLCPTKHNNMSTEQLTLRGAHTTETFHFIHPEYGQVTLNVYYTDCGDGRTDEEAEVVDANGDEIVDPDLLQELCDYVDSL